MAKIEIYKDRKGEFRFRLIAKNGKLITSSGEGYKRRAGVNKAITAVIRACKEGVPVFDLTKTPLIPRKGTHKKFNTNFGPINHVPTHDEEL